MLREIYYYDTTRIRSYLEQLASRKGRSLRWPSVEAKITWPLEIKFATGLEESKENLFKKIRKLEKALEASNQLSFMRPDGDHLERPFVREVCKAVRIEIPVRSAPDMQRGVCFWLNKHTTAQRSVSRLCLLEDFKHSDEAAISFSGASAYTLLQSLVHYARREISLSEAGGDIPDEPHPNPYAKFGTEHHPYSLEQIHNIRNCLYDFIENPIELCGRWKSIISDPRHIETIYRVREWGPESAKSGSDISVFGYPLWILSA
jgi:hypothetical protein